MGLEIPPGAHITVYDEKQTELGEGIFVNKTSHGSLSAYECREHTILVRGTHYILLNGHLHSVPASKSAAR